jgi:two-component system chemotaxis response regulator CheY
MNGLKLVSLVRHDPGYKNVPIVIVTTEGATEDRERALALGANDYITKPVQTTQLLEVAKRLLNLSM